LGRAPLRIRNAKKILDDGTPEEIGKLADHGYEIGGLFNVPPTVSCWRAAATVRRYAWLRCGCPGRGCRPTQYSVIAPSKGGG
jgi:hypothetical protein